MKQLTKRFLCAILSILSIICFSIGLVACNPNGGSSQGGANAKEELLAWATKTNEVVEYCDFYYAPMNIVSAGGNELLPTIKVTDSQGEGVALISDKFLIEDKGGYVVKYIVAYEGELYEKQITLNVVIADPNVFVADFGTYFAGIDSVLPSIVVMENDGEKIEYSYKVFNAENEEVSVRDGKINVNTAGDYFLSVFAQGQNGNAIEHKETFRVDEIPGGQDVVLKTNLNSNWFSTEDGDMPEGYTVYGYNGVKNTAKTMKVSFDIGMSLELLREKFVSIAFNVMYQGDGLNNTNVRTSENGANLPVYFHQLNEELANFGHWQEYTVTVPAAEFDGNLYFSSTGGDDASYCFGFKKVTAICDALVVEEFESEQVVYEEFSIPKAKYILNNVEQTGAEISISVQFNGEEVETAEKYTFGEEGKLKVTYTYGSLSKTITINVNNGRVLVTYSNIISKITNYSCTKGTAQVGDVSGAQYATEAAKALMFFAFDEDFIVPGPL